MVTGDNDGLIKYWQSNMNNVKAFSAHKEAVRDLRYAFHFIFRELLPKNGRDTPYLGCLWDCIYIAVLQIAHAILGFETDLRRPAPQFRVGSSLPFLGRSSLTKTTTQYNTQQHKFARIQQQQHEFGHARNTHAYVEPFANRGGGRKNHLHNRVTQKMDLENR